MGVAREGQVAVAALRDLIPQLGQVHGRDVENRIGDVAVGGFHLIGTQTRGMAHQLQRRVERNARKRDAVAAAPEEERRVLQHVPPHLLLALDDLCQTFSRRHGDGIFNIGTHVVVARDGVDRSPETRQLRHARAVELGRTDVDQVAGEDDQVGPQCVYGVDEPPQLLFGPEQCADVDVGELHDAQAVESCGQAVGAKNGPP